jgi:hypothetical protein
MGFLIRWWFVVWGEWNGSQRLTYLKSLKINTGGTQTDVSSQQIQYIPTCRTLCVSLMFACVRIEKRNIPGVSFRREQTATMKGR